MKNCKGKTPAFQFYVKDWLSDPELQKAHPTTRGIWINLLCYMWDAPDKGILKTNERELCQLGSCFPEDVEVFLSDAKRLNFCECKWDKSGTCPTLGQACPTNVTIQNRRMFRENKQRQKDRLRKQEYRNKKTEQEQKKEMSHTCPKNVPPPSPTPTPTPTPNAKIKERKELLHSSCSEPEKPLDSEPTKIPIFKILLIKKDGEFLVFQEDINQWQETFPGIDVLQILRNIRQWNFDNPKKRKTAKGIRKHISFWMGKEQDKGGKAGNLSSQVPRATTVYQEEIVKKNKLFQAYLQDEVQNEPNCRSPEVIDIENSSETIDPALGSFPRKRKDS